MGLLDGLMKQAGGLTAMAAQNPQAVAAVLSLLSSRDASVGGTNGLPGLVDLFQKKGLGDMMASWISTGPNPPIAPHQVTDVLGADVLSQFAAKAGVPQSEAGSLLASLLPAVVDHLTPQGSMPETNALESTLGGLLGALAR
jgi:uncharacterized protein YidB (DUF937 family)